MIVDSKSGEIRIKLVLYGMPHSGKCQILRDWSAQQGDNEVQFSRIGDSSVLRANFRWDHLPQEGWALLVTAYTTEGEISHTAINEMLLQDVDGVVFVAPVDGNRAQEMRQSMVDLGEILKRAESYIGEIPLVLHYHQAEKTPGIQAELLSDFLGVPRNAVPHVLTRSDDGSPLSDSLALMLKKMITYADSQLSEEEVLVTE